MKKLAFVTASVVALATAVPTFVPDVAAQPVDTKAPVANTHYPQCDEMPLEGFCDLIFCIGDPNCTAPGIED